jgi:biopolymer transport protein ExbD
MRFPRPYVRRRARIEIIPLIDIMFFLLATFVMVSLSMIKNRGIDVKLPAAESGAPMEERASATVTVTAAGAFYLDRQPMSLRELETRLGAMKGTRPDLQVVIHGDEQAMFGDITKVLDRIRLLGISDASIQTRHTPPSEEGRSRR